MLESGTIQGSPGMLSKHYHAAIKASSLARKIADAWYCLNQCQVTGILVILLKSYFTFHPSTFLIAVWMIILDIKVAL